MLKFIHSIDKQRKMKNRLKILRATLEISQADLAEKIGVSRQTINAMEAGKYAPSTILALKLSRVFRISVNEIFELENID